RVRLASSPPCSVFLIASPTENCFVHAFTTPPSSDLAGTNSPAIVVTKNCPATPVQPGQPLLFSGTVSNAGNITLTNVLVVNNQPEPNTTRFCSVNWLPGHVTNFTGSYNVPLDSCGPY